MSVTKIFIILGIVLILLGLFMPFFQKLGLGRLPGDIFFKSKNFSFYFPITTSIIISILLSVVLTILFWFFRK